MLSVKDALSRSKTLRPIYNQIQLKKQVKIIFDDYLPEHLSTQFEIISVKNNIIFIKVMTGSMATFLKQRQTFILNLINHNIKSLNISELKIQVNAHLQEQFLGKLSPISMTESEINHLENLTESFQNQQIKTALEKIIQTQKNLKIK